jgi:hypothetical protein
MRWVRHALLAVAVAAGGIAFGCSTEKVRFVPDEELNPPVDLRDGGDADAPPPPPPPSTPTACTADEDCVALPTTGVCDDAAGYCVECDPAREAELQRCGEGTYCSPNGSCVLGCQVDTDCRQLTCESDSGLCIHCTSDGECTPGTTCVGARCAPSCTSDETCPGGWLCCEGQCKNPGSDPASCGSCGNTCDPMGACWNGVCGTGPCEPGMAECDGDASNGCETKVTDDPKNCGKCGRSCASNFCAGGECTSKECAPGFADCNGSEDDQCETDLGSVDDCVMCGTRCSDTHGEPSCSAEGCGIACEDGFDDCDGKITNGCEIDLTDDEDHCGDCDTVCENEHGTTECTDGECVPRCASGYFNCDGDPSNGCETNTDTTESHCGGCGNKCNPDNATGTCTDGVCRVKCETGFEDCDGDAKNGCEADLSAPETCGSCDNFCADNGGKAICADPDLGSCDIECDPGRDDCLNGLTDGCETDITASASNCGGCGYRCTSSVGTPACVDSECGISDCTRPNMECVPDDGMKCETNVSADVNNCGDCSKACYFKNGSGSCTAETCELEGCATGYDDCNNVGADGCETSLGTKENCRTCGETCEAVHGLNPCTATGCQPQCATGWGDCDGNKNNGCETQLNSLTDCGQCATSCTKAHAIPTCASGTCEIAACADNWEDCSSNEGTSKDGCETQLHTSTHCEGCGLACNLAHGSSSCSTGTCRLTACATGYSNCNTIETDGCEVQIGKDANCAGCGDDCDNAHGSTSCTGPTSGPWVCKPVCVKDGAGKDTWGDCDGKPTNGCETDLRTSSNCGACGSSCTLANATPSCATGTCAVASCGTNFLNCDGSDGNGCETPRFTNDHCRTCTEVCTNAHAVGGCNTSTGCFITDCNPNYDDCDGNKSNGCETSLTTTSDCGECDAVCDFPTSSESCITGTCVATSCAPDFDDCDGDATCETALNTVSDCGACDRACTALNGTPSCGGAVGAHACNPGCSFGFATCDGNNDNGCERDIKTLSNCGACNASCSFANAAANCEVIASTSITCKMGACNSGFLNCDSSTATGCETAQGISNCGACGTVCSQTNAPNPCTGGACVPNCTGSGFGDCDSSRPNGCESPLNTSTNCGACGAACTRANATATCTTGSCRIGSCNANFGNCNGTDSDGCEKATNTIADCGTCGHACVALNGTPSCSGGVCNPGCNPATTGFQSCDGNPDNGCERNVRTLTDCGGCNVACDYTNASESCSTGTCTFGSCSAGFRSCDGTTANGCETPIDAANCEGCGLGCSNSHGTTSCNTSAGVCAPSCNNTDGSPTGYGDCDASRANGCETQLNSVSNCGACGNVCSGGTPDCVGVSGAYRCQARVKYENDAETVVVGSVGTAPSISLSHNLTVSSLSPGNRILLAAIISQCTATAGVSGARPTAVNYGGVAMSHTTALEQANDAGNPFDTPHIYYYYLTDSGTNKLPTSGAQTFQVTAANGKVIMLGANLILFSGANQTAPIVVGTGKSMVNAGATCAATGPVTPTLGGAALYALTAAHFYSTPISAQGGLIQSWGADAVSNSISIHGGYRDSATTALTTTSYTIGFNYAWCNPSGVLPIAILPYRQP